jgi:hypothetical protein
MSKQKTNEQVEAELIAALRPIRKHYGVGDDVPSSLIGPLQMIYILETSVRLSKNLRGAKKAAARLFEIGRLIGAGFPISEAPEGVDAIFENFGEAFSLPDENPIYQLWSEAFSIAQKFNALPDGWIFDPTPKQKGGSFYMSGALLRNKTRPHNKGEQLTLWGQLETHELEAVTRRGEVSIQQIKKNGVVRGLGGLTSSEHRLLLGLSQLLHEISKDTNDPTSKDYYTGEGTHPVKSDFTIGGGWPYFWIGTYELARICKGGGTVGGDDVKHIEATAKGLQEKTFLLSYQLQRNGKTKGRNTTIQDTLSTQDSIIKVLQFERQERDNETGELVQDRTEICIALNPLFRHGIESYFVEWPSDTIERLEATKEGKRIPEANWILLDYLKTKSSNYTGKEETVTDRIDVQTMLEKLYPTYMEQKRRKRATEEAEKALSHAMRAGFLSKWETDKGQGGQLQYILTIPKKW